MTELFDIKNIKGKIFFTILGVVLVLVLFVFGYMMPMRTKIAKLEENLADLDRQRQDASRKVDDLVILKENLPSILRDQFTVNRLVPDEPQHAKIVEFIHYLSELYALDVEVTDFTEPQPLPLAKVADDKKSDEEKKLDAKLIRTLRRFQATIRIGGPFNNVISFIRDFKRSNRYFEIFAITIPEEETARALPDTYPISMDGYFYFYAPDEEAGADSGQEKNEFERLIEAEGLGEKYLSDGSAQPSIAGSQEPEESATPSLEEFAKEQPQAGQEGSENENPENSGNTASSEGTIQGSSVRSSSIVAGNFGVGFKSGSITFGESWIGRLFESALSEREVA